MLSKINKSVLLCFLLFTSTTFGWGVWGTSVRPQKTKGTATLLVAASDAPANIKAIADYICDGTADEVQIQAAIDALASGGIIGVSIGDFNFAAKIEFDASDSKIILEGSGDGTVFKQAIENYSLLASNASSGQMDVILTDVAGFAPGMKVIVGDDDDWDDKIIDTITNNTLTLTTNLDHAFTTVKNAFCLDWYNLVEITGASGVVIRNILFDSQEDDGTDTLATMGFGSGTRPNDIRRIPIYVKDNAGDFTVESCKFQDYLTNAILVAGTNNDVIVTVLNNRFETGADYIQTRAIALENKSPRSIIRDNNIYGGTVGVYLLTSHGSSVIGNTIDLRNITITSNNDEMGIYAASSNDITLNGNTIMYSGIGIQLKKVIDSTISANEIVNCVKGITFTGVNPDPSSGCTVTGNTIGGDMYYGIYCTTYGVADSVISVNTIHNSNTPTSRIGIKLDCSATTGNLIHGNNITGFATPMQISSGNKQNHNMLETDYQGGRASFIYFNTNLYTNDFYGYWGSTLGNPNHGIPMPRDGFIVSHAIRVKINVTGDGTFVARVYIGTTPQSELDLSIPYTISVDGNGYATPTPVTIDVGVVTFSAGDYLDIYIDRTVAGDATMELDNVLGVLEVQYND